MQLFYKRQYNKYFCRDRRHDEPPLEAITSGQLRAWSHGCSAVLCRGSGESLECLDAENEQFDVFTTTSVTAGVKSQPEQRAEAWVNQSDKTDMAQRIMYTQIQKMGAWNLGIL